MPDQGCRRRADRLQRFPAIFTGIPAERCEEFWPVVSPVLWRAIVRTGGAHTLLTTKHAIQDGRMQLWAVFTEPGMETCSAALVTQTQIFPSGEQACEIVFAAGDVIPDCLQFLPLIEDWARKIGCSRMRLIGRRGWSKVLAIYEESAVVLERSL